MRRADNAPVSLVNNIARAARVGVVGASAITAADNHRTRMMSGVAR